MSDLEQNNGSAFEGESAPASSEIFEGERRSRELAELGDLVEPETKLAEGERDPLLDPDDPRDMVINIQEAAKICNLAYQTIRKCMVLDKDFPPYRIGSRGKGYEMSAVRVVAYFKRIEAEKEQARERRAEQLEQFGLGLPETEEDRDLAKLKPAELKQHYEARRIANQVAVASGQLLEVGAVRTVLEEVFEGLRRAIQEDLPDELATRYSFDREQRVDLEDRCAKILQRAADRLVAIGEVDDDQVAAGGLL